MSPRGGRTDVTSGALRTLETCRLSHQHALCHKETIRWECLEGKMQRNSSVGHGDYLV